MILTITRVEEAEDQKTIFFEADHIPMVLKIGNGEAFMSPMGSSELYHLNASPGSDTPIPWEEKWQEILQENAEGLVRQIRLLQKLREVAT